jgi:hypothetical protein
MGRFLHLAKRCTHTAKELYDGVAPSGAVTLTGTAPTVSFRCLVTVAPRPYYTTNLTGTHNDIVWMDTVGTTSACSIAYASVAGQALSVSVTGSAITVNLATTSGGVITTTASEIVALAALSASLIAIGVTAALKAGDNGTGLVTVLNAASFTSGLDMAGSLVLGADTLTFTIASKKTSTSTLTSLPTVTNSGLDCNVLIECIDAGGAPIYTTTETDLPCKIEIKSKSIPAPTGGWTSIASTQLQARGHFDVGDMIKFNIDLPFDPTLGTEYPIVSFGPKAAYMGKESIKILQF